MEDGKHVWVQLLDRPQKLLKVVVIAIESFVSDRDKAPFPYVLWEEHTEVWINVSLNRFYFASTYCFLVHIGN